MIYSTAHGQQSGCTATASNERNRHHHIVRERLLPAIGDPEVEAQKASEAYWNDKMSEPVGDDGDVDPGSIADDANEKAIGTYMNCSSLYDSQLSILERLACFICLSRHVPVWEERGTVGNARSSSTFSIGCVTRLELMSGRRIFGAIFTSCTWWPMS